MKSRVVVITGASAGVGRAVAREFAKQHARIGLISRGRDGLEAAKREVEELGGEAIVLPLDVADADAVESATARVEETFGPIDIWVNNAMVSVFSPIRELTPEDVRRVTEVTYLGYVHGTLSALKRMLPRDEGVIIQVGSALAYRGIPLQAAYCGAKHAIQGFNDSLYTELLHDQSRVRLTMVNLPAINTPQFNWSKSRMSNRAQPVPPIYQPEVAARAIVWSADNVRRELNVGWPTTKAVIGNNLVPGYADSYLAQGGYESQQTDEPEDPSRGNNLHDPLPGDHGAHGRFDARARDSSLFLEMNLHRNQAGPLAVLALAGLVEWLRGGSKEDSEARATRLSRELRGSRAPHLKRRRKVVALSMVASASMGVIALYQMGLIRHLPEPPLARLNADKVDGSAEAYEKFQMPDGVLGLLSYAVTMALASIGGKNRHRKLPWLPVALAAKTGFDAASAAKLTLDQWAKHRAFCSWCLIAAGATFAMAPLVYPEAREAAKVLTGRKA